MDGKGSIPSTLAELFVPVGFKNLRLFNFNDRENVVEAQMDVECQKGAALEKQAASLNFPLTKLLVVIGSKRSAHSNAYLYGFWNNKRIVLFDTLLCSEEKQKVLKVCGEAAQEARGLTNDEVLAVLGHELGHWYLWHFWILLSLLDLNLLVMLMAFAKFYKWAPLYEARGLTNDEVLAVLGHELGHWYLWHFWILLSLLDLNLLVMLMAFAKFYKWAPLYEVFGFSGTPTIIGIILVYTFVLGPYFELAKTLMNTAVRRCEYAADGFSANLGYGDQLVGGLKKLGKDNLYLPVDDPLYSMCNHDHPTVAERIEAIKKRQ
ncbi:peptidase, M48 family [Ancylostoma ceylanicum]|uniref:Peptidase, M48 family n=1 Tax=Ancylostoma ceylanicum TaxID=53326 RepID=A0A0D6M1A1_9BILA|nr:peptidase, M48 family [Ancylostoma ceylanicum]